MREAVEQLRTSSASLEALRTRRNPSVERLLRFARSQLASARWPGDPASYQRRANAQLQAAEHGWTALRASGGDVDRFLVPVAEVIGWTQRRTDGVRFFDGFDQELEAAVRAAFSNQGRGFVSPVAAPTPHATPTVPPQTAAARSCESLAGHWTAQNYLKDPALQSIAEIIHDIDLKDAKFAREETIGIDRLIAGIATRHKDDDGRLACASAMFDYLYEFF